MNEPTVSKRRLYSWPRASSSSLAGNGVIVVSRLSGDLGPRLMVIVVERSHFVRPDGDRHFYSSNCLS